MTGKWFKTIFSRKKEDEKGGNEPTTMKQQSAPVPVPSPREKKRWSFRRPTAAAGRELINTVALSTSAPAAGADGLSESEMEQNRHALAVSAATATAAEVAAAATTAVLLTATASGSSRANNAEEEDAATKIQSYFRSYLVFLPLQKSSEDNFCL